MGRTFPELADESPDALFALSLDGVILSWNQGVAETFGYSAAEAIGQKLDDLVIPEDRRAEAGRKMAAAIDGAATRFETTRRHKNGSSVTVDVAMRLIRPPDGERYLAVSNKNVTERKLLEEKLRETSRHKGEFLANMSHELRTPLNAIIGFTELMYSGNAGPIAPLHREYLGDVLRSAKHLLRVVNDVLDLARVESGTLEYRPEPVEMGQLVDEVRDVLRGLATRKNLTIEAYVDPEAAHVVIDAARIRQVLYNYLSNAIKFTPEGGTICVRIGPTETPAEFRLDVEDSGIGISEDNVPNLFVEFQQLDANATRRHEGTGLGLALTKRIVEGHHGRVMVKSTLGKGSTFSAILPRKPK
ncbi:MAG: PAS domain-containing sensor histidine kinase [Myxococcota bacterium]|nr:PAS domain-containing sensor histidine kinase [Myxococcota bacterium]